MMIINATIDQTYHHHHQVPKMYIKKLQMSDLIQTKTKTKTKTETKTETKTKTKMKCLLCNKEGHRSDNKKYHNTPVPPVPPVPQKKATMSIFISREEAEKSATEWLGPSPSLMRDWLILAIMDKKQHRDIGKVLAYVSESHVNKWLSEQSGRPIKSVIGESWDGITEDDGNKIRNQIKFRMDAWHFETTRRNSQKNSETNSTGHVAYRRDEFDVVAIFKPGPTFGITGSTIRCIPVSVLINPKKPDQLVTNIPMAIKKIYDNEAKTLEVIKMLYFQRPL